MNEECHGNSAEERKLLIDKVTDLPRWVLIPICLAMLLLVAFIDYATGNEVSVNFAYLLPIALVGWAFGTWAGAGASLLSVGFWLVADYVLTENSSGAAVPYWNAFVLLLFFLAFAILLSRLQMSLEHERELSRTDPLTGSCNSRSFYEQAARELERAQRYGHPVSMAYLDLDNFKQVNDTFGHAAGDRVLQAITDSIESNVRSSDIVSRLGGDEFCVLFPETGEEAAREAVEKLRQALEEGLPAEYRDVVGFSIGLVTFDDPPEKVDEVIKAADHLMYKVKSAGKNGVAHAVNPAY